MSLKGRAARIALRSLPRRGESPSGAPLEPCADHGKRELVGEQLVISEPRPCRRRGHEIGLGLRRMQTRERLGESRAKHSVQECRIDPFRQLRQLRQRFADRLAQASCW